MTQARTEEEYPESIQILKKKCLARDGDGDLGAHPRTGQVSLELPRVRMRMGTKGKDAGEGRRLPKRGD